MSEVLGVLQRAKDTHASRARGVKLQAKPKGSTSRSVGGEEREPRRTRPAAPVALPVGASSAAAALSVTNYGTEAERAEWAAVLAASAAPVENGPPGDVPVLPVDSLPHALGWQQPPAWGERPELYPFTRRTGAGAVPWRRAPRCLHGRDSSSRTRTALRGFPAAGRLHRVAADGARHPRRGPRPVCGGPARSVAT